MGRLRWVDLVVVIAYMAGMAAIGMRFSRRQTSTETYFLAKRSVPSWAMGLSLLATLISSVTFVAYPGSSYAKDWSLLVPGFMVIGVLTIVGSVIIPFYRHVVGMSTYEYFEKRFGRPTRTYSSIAFSLAHFSKMGFVFYLMGLTIGSTTGWNVDYVILAVGVVMVFYTIAGGMEAVIWTDVIQAFLSAGRASSFAWVFYCSCPKAGPAPSFVLQRRTVSSVLAHPQSISRSRPFPFSFCTVSSGTCSATRRIKPWCSAILSPSPIAEP